MSDTRFILETTFITDVYAINVRLLIDIVQVLFHNMSLSELVPSHNNLGIIICLKLSCHTLTLHHSIVTCHRPPFFVSIVFFFLSVHLQHSFILLPYASHFRVTLFRFSCPWMCRNYDFESFGSFIVEIKYRSFIFLASQKIAI